MGDIVHIAVSITENYLPYFSVMIKSLEDACSADRKYCVHVLSSDVQLADVKRATGNIANYICFDLIDMNKYSLLFDGFSFEAPFGPECFYRLVLAEVLPDLNKVIYLDSDLLVLEDLAQLFDCDLSDKCLAAVRDIGTVGMVSGFDLDERNRLLNLGIEDGLNYYNSGVLLVDLDVFRARYRLRDMVDWVLENHPRYPDQDCINRFFSGDILSLPMRWNVLFDSEDIRVGRIAKCAPADLYKEYLYVLNHPAILHFAGPFKPWMKPGDGFDRFWQFARNSSLYEYVIGSIGCFQATSILDNKIDCKLYSVWKTVDDLYFQINEGERIREDLHRRLSQVEDSLKKQSSKIVELEEEIGYLRSLKTPMINKVYSKIKSRNN